MQYLILLSFTYLGAAVGKHIWQWYCFRHWTSVFSCNSPFTYFCSNLLAFLRNGCGVDNTRLWIYCSCNEEPVYVGDKWPACQCWLQDVWQTWGWQNTQTRAPTHTACLPQWKYGQCWAVDTDSEKCIFDFLHRWCGGAAMHSLALVEEAMLLITSSPQDCLYSEVLNR